MCVCVCVCEFLFYFCSGQLIKQDLEEWIIFVSKTEYKKGGKSCSWLNIQGMNYMIHGQFKFQFDDGFSILELLHVLQIYI